MKSPNMNSPCILTILTLLVLWIILEVPTVSSHNESSNPDVATNTTCPTNDSNATTLLWNTPWTSEDLYKELDCDNVFSTERPIHSSAVWIYLQALYIGIVGPTNSSIALVSTSSSLYQPDSSSLMKSVTLPAKDAAYSPQTPYPNTHAYGLRGIPHGLRLETPIVDSYCPCRLTLPVTSWNGRIWKNL